MLVLRSDVRADAPVLLCDVAGCGWAWPLADVEGPEWDELLALGNQELARHVAAGHSPAELGWEVAMSWTEEGSATVEPDRAGGPAWEPFAAAPLERAGVPGTEVVWRRSIAGRSIA